jgi:hypothetical protein
VALANREKPPVLLVGRMTFLPALSHVVKKLTRRWQNAPQMEKYPDRCLHFSHAGRYARPLGPGNLLE